MNLYIPEIGDHIRLTEDWTFDLHAEHRNTDLATMFNHYLHSCYLNSKYENGWVDSTVLPLMREPDYSVVYPDREHFKNPLFKTFRGKYDWDAFNAAQRKAEEDCPNFVKWSDDSATHKKAATLLSKPKMSVTIPKGCVLAIDRIYIRKGKTDYSSITFYVKEFGEIDRAPRRFYSEKKTKRSALRFWTKLEDCNKIQFEKTEKI